LYKSEAPINEWRYCGVARNIAKSLPKTFISNAHKFGVAAEILRENGLIYNDWTKDLKDNTCVC
jgi:hypothetical protein